MVTFSGHLNSFLHYINDISLHSEKYHPKLTICTQRVDDLYHGAMVILVKYVLLNMLSC